MVPSLNTSTPTQGQSSPNTADLLPLSPQCVSAWPYAQYLLGP